MFNVLIGALALTLSGGAVTPTLVAKGEPASEPELVAKSVTAFKAGRIYLGDGRVLEQGVVIVTDGIITNVGKQLEVPANAAVVEHEGCISPGLIALHSLEGTGGELHDSTRTVLPDADASFAFRPEDMDFQRTSRAGITSVVLVPSSRALVGGQSVVVKTHGGKIVKRGAQLALGLSRSALNYNKFPTSYDGAMGELDRLFSDPEGPISRAAAGNLSVVMSVGTRAEMLRALDFAGRHGLKGALHGSYWAEDVVTQIKQSGFAVICTAFDVGDSERGVRSVKALSEAGVRFGFTLDAPSRHPESLRFGAALCVRGGLDAHVARRALTGDAAQIAGVAGRIGGLRRGLDADLVLWSGDPIHLASSIEAVYIDGKLVAGGKQ